jgi:hypothetical protein
LGQKMGAYKLLKTAVTSSKQNVPALSEITIKIQTHCSPGSSHEVLQTTVLVFFLFIVEEKLTRVTGAIVNQVQLNPYRW